MFLKYILKVQSVTLSYLMQEKYSTHKYTQISV